MGIRVGERYAAEENVWYTTRYGINVCELVFVSEMDVFITCFNSRTIYQVGGLQ